MQNAQNRQQAHTPYSTEVMTDKEANAILTDAYGSLENPKTEMVDTSLGLCMDRQKAAEKPYHGGTYGVDPLKNGMTKDQVNAIQKRGLKNYIQCGGELPPKEFVDKYINGIKSFYNENKENSYSKASFRGECSMVVHASESRGTLIFNPESKKLTTPMQLRKQQMDRYLETGRIGDQAAPTAPGT